MHKEVKRLVVVMVAFFCACALIPGCGFGDSPGSSGRIDQGGSNPKQDLLEGFEVLYEFEMNDLQGSEHTVKIVSRDMIRETAPFTSALSIEGDVICYGTFEIAWADKETTEYQMKEFEISSLNLNHELVRVDERAEVDFLLIAQPIASMHAAMEIYYIDGGQLKQAGFSYDEEVRYGPYDSITLFVGEVFFREREGCFETGVYDRMGSYHISRWLFDAGEGLFNFVEKLELSIEEGNSYIAK